MLYHWRLPFVLHNSLLIFLQSCSLNMMITIFKHELLIAHAGDQYRHTLGTLLKEKL